MKKAARFLLVAFTVNTEQRTKTMSVQQFDRPYRAIGQLDQVILISRKFKIALPLREMSLTF